MGTNALADDDIVLIEAMDCMWKLPWKSVKNDVKTGFAIFIKKVVDKPR